VFRIFRLLPRTQAVVVAAGRVLTVLSDGDVVAVSSMRGPAVDRAEATDHHVLASR